MKFFLLFIFSFLHSFLCDLPVHCLSSQIAGVWKLYFDPPTASSRPSCGHSTPDRNTDHLTAKMPVLPLQKNVILKFPNLAYFSEDEGNFNKNVAFLEAKQDQNYKEEGRDAASPDIKEKQQKTKSISFLDANYQYYLNSNSIFTSNKVQPLPDVPKKADSSQKLSEVKLGGGRWTMVYDEGFEIQISEYNFFAFSKYAKKFGKAAKDGDDSEIEGYESICGRTWLGWVRKRDKWGCFYGEKEEGEERRENREVFEGGVGGEKIVEREELTQKKEQTNLSKKISHNYNSEPEKTGLNSVSEASSSEGMALTSNKKASLKENTGLSSDSDLDANMTNTGDKEAKKEKKGRLRGSNGPLPSDRKLLNDYDMYIFHEIPHAELLKKPADDEKFVADHRFIEKVNAQENSLWKAKYHPELMENSSLRDMQQMLGLTHNYFEKIKVKHSYKSSSFLETSTLSSTYSSPSSSPSSTSSSSFPSSFSWTDIDTPVKRQGSCGSCYALATLAALEVRIRIKFSSSSSSTSSSSSSSSSLLHPSSAQPFLSPSSAVSCSQYNQGCDGGYPYLTAKEGTEKGFFEESCQPTPGDCKSECFKGKIWKVKKTKKSPFSTFLSP